MSDQYEVSACISHELPEIEEEFTAMSPSLNIFKSIQCLAIYAKRKVAEHDFPGVKKCFSLAEKLYSNGNAIVKNAIENVFVFSFSALLNTCTYEERNELQSIMPLGLHSAFTKQVLSSCI